MRRSAVRSTLVTGMVVGALVLPATGVSAGGGTVSGRVTWTGGKVAGKPIDRNSDPVCAKTARTDPSVLVAPDGKGLANVVVRIVNAPAAAAVPAEPVVIDQKECMYEPRVQTAVAGQKVEVRNSDQTLHNVHAYDGKRTLFNRAQPPSARPVDAKATAAGGVLAIKCDVHTWMRAFVLLTSSGLAAVSGPDGNFAIKGVPAGSYDVEAWHETLGSKTAKITVTEGGAAKLDLSFAPK